RRCAFKKQLQGLAQIIAGTFNAVTLASDVQFWTQRNISIIFPFNDCGQLTIYSLLLSNKIMSNLISLFPKIIGLLCFVLESVTD
ncbi:MAG: hypothetical protein MUP22_07810, partial [Desulfobacterales bacterium]|nr:hypothetical protein [Desulfobacterales bacterium]